MKHWASDEVAILRGLRERFLVGATASDYWRSERELALYDATFGARIGWKWDAVLDELQARGWESRAEHLFDWGCGSGVASRAVLARWPIGSCTTYDRSPLAEQYAEKCCATDYPNVRTVRRATVSAETLLVISHVLNELPQQTLNDLLDLARNAGEIIWVEPGAYAESRRLIDVRQQLLDSGFSVVAPCTHQSVCGLQAPINRRHWCHYFASSPAAIHQDGRWREFAEELQIDLRALPYSFVVLQRAPRTSPLASGTSRIVGAPRHFKGYSKILSCQATGVCEFMLQKRDAPELLRRVRRGSVPPLYQWELERDKIRGAIGDGAQRGCEAGDTLA